MKKFKVKGHIKDLVAFSRLRKLRISKIRSSSAEPKQPDILRQLAHQLHPNRLSLVVDKIIRESDDTKTLFLKLNEKNKANPTQLPNFRAGQYIVLKVPVGNLTISRPYSISSTPEEALTGDFYTITIAVEGEGVASNQIVNNWETGLHVESSGPLGFFHHDSIRDSNTIIAIAGGTGITPIRSIIKDLLQHDTSSKIHLIYGARDASRILFQSDWSELVVKESRFQYTPVYSEAKEGCSERRGFITAELIQEIAGPDLSQHTFFVCGPPPMYEYLEEQFKALEIPAFRIRNEVFGPGHSIERAPGFPVARAEDTVTITVRNGISELRIPGMVKESIAISMEKANIPAPTKCRSGSCGYCRSFLLKGDIFINPIIDRRRKADELYSFFNPCSSYPLSDIILEIPRDK